MKRGFLHFHQGWTDIVNCLSLIKWYSDIYDELVVLNREDSKKIVDFFCVGLKNVRPIYLSKYLLDEESNGRLHIIDYLKHNRIIEIENYDLLIHGFPDHYRNDQYKSIFPRLFNNFHFVEGFYVSYDIPYSTRINFFDFTRNYSDENKEYSDFVGKYGYDYILYHEDPTRNMGYPLPIVKGENYVNLNGNLDNVFSYIKILENAKHLHLIDSVWASFCYLLDSKYSILRNTEISLYPLINRPGGCLNYIPNIRPTNLYPKDLKNWKIINYF